MGYRSDRDYLQYLYSVLLKIIAQVDTDLRQLEHRTITGGTKSVDNVYSRPLYSTE
jgi:hypothetical protein